MQKKILLVDDEPKNLKILEEIFDGDFQLSSASGYREALSKVKTFNPDIVLLDIMMPDGSGIELCARLRNLADFEHSIIIMVSGKALLEDRLMAYEAGANDFLTKPFVDDELHAKVKVFSRLANFEKGLLRENAELQKAVESSRGEEENSKRMKGIATGITEIVHNLKRPLMAIEGYMNLTNREYPECKYNIKMAKILGRLNEFVETVLNTSKPLSMECGDIKSVIEEEMEMVQISSEAKQIEWTVEADGEDYPCSSKLCMHQIISLLVNNSVEAMADSKEKKITITINRADRVYIEFKDSGKEMYSGFRSSLFAEERSFAKMQEGRNHVTGQGFGLLPVQKLVDSLNGNIKMDSTLGKGNSVYLSFPVEDD